MQDPDYPFVSVIIPVFNDGERLKQCLLALAKQTYPLDKYEVIVVDNGSDNLSEIELTVSKFAQTTLETETHPGSYAARNKGISIAKGELVAFTDADCIPDDNWLEEGMRRFLQASNCGLVAGKIEIFPKDRNHLTMVELYELTYGFPQQEFVKIHKYGATANLFTSKQVINDVGLFDPTLRSNGDFDWGQRVDAKGYVQIYADSVCVAHPARRTLKELYLRNLRLAGGTYDIFCKKNLPKINFIKLIIRFLFEHITSPFIFFITVLGEQKVSGFFQKAKVIFVFSFLKYVKVFEIIRLSLLGGESARL